MVFGVIKYAFFPVNNQPLCTSGNTWTVWVDIILVIGFPLRSNALPVAEYPASPVPFGRMKVRGAFQVFHQLSNVSGGFAQCQCGYPHTGPTAFWPFRAGRGKASGLPTHGDYPGT